VKLPAKYTFFADSSGEWANDGTTRRDNTQINEICQSGFYPFMKISYWVFHTAYVRYHANKKSACGTLEGGIGSR
jgi:hypothetical protein